MKTAIIRTDFWKEDKIFNLLPEARLFYLCILTSPERNGTPAFKCSDRLMGFFTGFNSNVIETCKKQLLEAGLIDIIDDYFIIREQDYVQPHKGKLSLLLTEKELTSLPENIKELLMSRSGAIPERIGISKSKSNSINKSKDIDTNATRLANLLCSSIRENFNFVKCKETDVSKWADEIERINRIDGYDYIVIEAVLKWSQQDNFWKQNIQSGAKLRKQFTRLLVAAKVETDNKKVKVF